MPKGVLLLLLFLSVAFFFPINTALAGSFQVTKIGSLSTAGLNYNEWWYTANNPTISGQAVAGSSVDVTIDGTKSTVTADGLGNWSVATKLTEGDHKIDLSSSGSNLSFTLHLGPNLPGSLGSASASIPATGNASPAIGVVLVSAFLVVLGVGLARNLTAKSRRS